MGATSSAIEQIIAALDARPPEVVIQALLVEVTLDATDEFGIELGLQDPLLLARSTTSTVGGITSILPGLNFNNLSREKTQKKKRKETPKPRSLFWHYEHLLPVQPKERIRRRFDSAHSTPLL